MVNMEALVFCVFACFVFMVFCCSLMKIRALIDEQKSRALVLVFGDLERSPRMKNHVASLCLREKDVAYCGYGNMPSPNRTLCAMLPLPHLVCPSWLPYFMQVAVKLVIFVAQSMYLLWNAPPLDTIVVQNPPTFPTILLGWLCKWLNGTEKCRLIVDMHNTGYSIVAMKLKLLEQPAMWFEWWCLRTFPDTVLVVSEASQAFLMKWGIQSTVVYDLPHDFQPATEDKKSALWSDLQEEFGSLNGISVGEAVVVVSSTSWTPDEDFSLLLRALPEVDREIKRRVVLFITGKGALRDAFMKNVARLGLKRITVLSVWLPIAKYPVLLSMADFGLSMHQSSSGIDLPMKIIDMFACGTPVLARSFSALPELVDAENGFVFHDAAELAELLTKIISLDERVKAKLRNGVLQWQVKRGKWEEQWESRVWPAIKPCYETLVENPSEAGGDATQEGEVETIEAS